MMKRILKQFGFLLLMPVAAAVEQPGSIAPVEMPAVLNIPLPKGQSIDFVLVRVSTDKNAFSSVPYEIGMYPFSKATETKAGYTNTQAHASVSGTLYVNREKTPYWAIPMARTELSRGQYCSLMSPEKMPKAAEAKLPQTNLTKSEVEAFLDTFNRYLYSNPAALKNLSRYCDPETGNVLYARLPMENEWEFAARGATYVSKEVFRSNIPYASLTELKQHEALSNGMVKSISEVASKNKCNPAGLYDMLGNAEELVADPFRPEYNFGRVGGLLVRGGCYLTDPKLVSSATRREICPINEKDGSAMRDSAIGFRPVLGSQITPDTLNAIHAVKEDWRAYRQALIVHHPGESTATTTQDSIERENMMLRDQLAELTKQLNEQTVSGSKKDLAELRTELSGIQAEIDNMTKQLKAAKSDVAKGALFLIYYSAFDAVRDEMAARTCVLNASLVSDAAPRSNLLDRAAALRSNFPTYWEKFDQGCIMLADLPQEVIDAAIKERYYEIEQAVHKNPAYDTQHNINILRCSLRLAADYRTHRHYLFDEKAAGASVPEKWVEHLVRAAHQKNSK